MLYEARLDADLSFVFVLKGLFICQIRIIQKRPRTKLRGSLKTPLHITQKAHLRACTSTHAIVGVLNVLQK